MGRREESMREILQRIQHSQNRFERKLDGLRHEVRMFRIDEATGDYLMARTIEDVLVKVREAKTVSESNNIAMREELRLLRAGKNDPAKIDEAIALIEGIMADDSAVLTENTPAEGGGEEPPVTPSTHF